MFDIELLTRRLEGLYADMARDYSAGLLPQPQLGNLEAYSEIGLGFDHDAHDIGALSDYHGHYREGLKARHLFSPLAEDARLWSRPAIDAAEATSAPPSAVERAA